MTEILRDNNYIVRSGVRRTPSADVPAGSSQCEIEMSRDNWPAQGITIQMFLTYDGTNYVATAPATFIAAGSIDPKTGVIPPAKIGFGWGRDPQPLRALIETNSPSQFQTSAVIRVG
jgi:hypothetical protein